MSTLVISWLLFNILWTIFFAWKTYKEGYLTVRDVLAWALGWVPIVGTALVLVVFVYDMLDHFDPNKIIWEREGE